MEQIERPADRPRHEDILESAPFIGRATTQLERSMGPSCLLSLIIVTLATIILKRYFHLSWNVLFCFAIIVWFGVLTLLVRWRPDVVEEEPE